MYTHFGTQMTIPAWDSNLYNYIVCVCVCTHTHIRIHTYIHTHIHTHIHAGRHTNDHPRLGLKPIQLHCSSFFIRCYWSNLHFDHNQRIWRAFVRNYHDYAPIFVDTSLVFDVPSSVEFGAVGRHRDGVWGPVL